MSAASGIAVDPYRSRIYICGIFDEPGRTVFKGIVTVNMDGSNRQRFAQTEADLFSITLVHGKDRVCASDTYKANIFCFDAKTGKMDKRYLMKITMITFVATSTLQTMERISFGSLGCRTAKMPLCKSTVAA